MGKDKKCGSCKGFMKWCRKRRSTNSCDKPACEDNWGEMRGDIEWHPYYTHYYPVPELPIEEDEE